MARRTRSQQASRHSHQYQNTQQHQANPVYRPRHSMRRRSLSQRFANASIVAGVALLFLTRVAVVTRLGRRTV